MNYYNFAEIKHMHYMMHVKIMKMILLILQELLKCYQNDTVPENSDLPYENNKIPNVIQSEYTELLQLFKVKKSYLKF